MEKPFFASERLFPSPPQQQKTSVHFGKVSLAMTHVVAEPCFNCKYTDCVTVCPVECFYEGEAMLFIHPEECIDCEACVPECPPAAIFHQDNLPAEWADYTALNAEMAPNCPVITERKDPMGPPIEGKGGH
jgi:ferredoxin